MRLRVAVVYGGRSGEHEISLRSAKSIMEAMDPEKYKILHFMISKEGKWRPRPIVPEPNGNPEIDVVFPVLHGTFGEDGTLQGLLELAGLPYVGAGVLGSAIGMDKDVAKRLMQVAGIPVVPWIAVQRADWERDPKEIRRAIEKKFKYPVFVKPATLRSYVRLTQVHSRTELGPALDLAAEFAMKIMVERAVSAREIEVS